MHFSKLLIFTTTILAVVHLNKKHNSKVVK